MVNISTMKYQKANIFDIFDALPDTLKTNLPLSDPPANKRDISCPFSCRFCFSKAEVLTLASPSTSKSWGTIWWANWRRNDANDTYTQEFLKVVHIEFWSCHMTPPLSESNPSYCFRIMTCIFFEFDPRSKGADLAAKTERRVVNTQLAISRWTLKNEDQTNVQLVVELQAWIHWIQTPIKQY